MKKIRLFIAITLQLAILSGISAQEKKINVYDSATVYYEKKDFKKAFEYYEAYYANPTQGINNIDTYYAAVSACNAGNIERAKYYLKKSAAIGYEIPEYKKYEMDSAGYCLHDLKEWKDFISVFKFKSDSLLTILAKTNAAINDTSIRINKPAFSSSYWHDIASKSDAKQLVNSIKTFNHYRPTKKTNFWTLYKIKANDTLTVPFLVHIPRNYNPKQKTPLYIYLHGAIINRSNFATPGYIPNGEEVKIMGKAMEQNALIIYPFGKKDFGWLYQQQAFENVIQELEYIKSLYNVDDNKVYIGGHSNGGSGAFWFALNHSYTFAATFGFNYLPKAYLGNTSLRNLTNQTPFYGISGSEDTSFPITTVSGLYSYALTNQANWKNFTKKGGHGLPFSNRDSINFIFDTLATHIRNPFPKKIIWETDHIQNGRNAWIEIVELDTLADKANWHTLLNPALTQNGKTGIVDFNKNKSGAILATANGNTIAIQTSRVKKIKLYISPEMFDFNQQLKITLNGKEFINIKLDLDKQVILEEFLKTKDRVFIVANKIEFTVK